MPRQAKQEYSPVSWALSLRTVRGVREHAIGACAAPASVEEEHSASGLVRLVRRGRAREQATASSSCSSRGVRSGVAAQETRFPRAVTTGGGTGLSRRLPRAPYRIAGFASARGRGDPGLAFAPSRRGFGACAPDTGDPSRAFSPHWPLATSGDSRPCIPRSPAASAARTPCIADSGRPSETGRA